MASDDDTLLVVYTYTVTTATLQNVKYGNTDTPQWIQKRFHYGFCYISPS